MGGHATTVHAVEQAYFKQHQYMQQMRPLADVMSSVCILSINNFTENLFYVCSFIAYISADRELPFLARVWIGFARYQYND